VQSVEGMEEKYNFAINTWIEEKKKSDNRSRKWNTIILIIFSILLSIHMIFDYVNEERRKARADKNQIEYEQSLKFLYGDTTGNKKVKP
jgi:hypothetical protein